MTEEQAKALADYWDALLPEDEEKAYARMLELGMPDEYDHGLEDHFARQEYLYAHLPVCPECVSAQVQHTSPVAVLPAKWRCRDCGYKFIYEPSTTHS